MVNSLVQGAYDCIRALEVSIRHPHWQHVFIKTIPFNAFRIAAINNPVEVHKFLLSAILNPDEAKRLRLMPVPAGKFFTGSFGILYGDEDPAIHLQIGRAC